MTRIKSPIGKRRGAPAELGESEGGDAFRAQHQARRVDEREVEGVRRPVLVNEAESPLGWLKRRKDRNGRPLISDEQYQARRAAARRLLVRAPLVGGGVGRGCRKR
jgi:hypothetical protein